MDIELTVVSDCDDCCKERELTLKPTKFPGTIWLCDECMIGAVVETIGEDGPHTVIREDPMVEVTLRFPNKMVTAVQDGEKARAILALMVFLEN